MQIPSQEFASDIRLNEKTNLEEISNDCLEGRYSYFTVLGEYSVPEDMNHVTPMRRKRSSGLC